MTLETPSNETSFCFVATDARQKASHSANSLRMQALPAGGGCSSQTGGCENFFSFLRKLRREVMTMYITLEELLLLGTFVLAVVKFVIDIQNKKK